MLLARGRMLARTHNIIPMPVSQSSNGLSLSKFSPVAAEAVRTFASIVGKGAATAKAFGAFATFVKEGAKREGRVRRF